MNYYNKLNDRHNRLDYAFRWMDLRKNHVDRTKQENRPQWILYTNWTENLCKRPTNEHTEDEKKNHYDKITWFGR